MAAVRYLDIIVVGNPVDGFSFIGPFEDGEVAANWAENYASSEWWLATLDSPVEGKSMTDDTRAILEDILRTSIALGHNAEMVQSRLQHFGVGDNE